MKSKRYRDPVVEAYMPGVDRTLLRENLKLTFEERLEKLQLALQIIEKLRHSGKHSKFLNSVKTTEEVFKFGSLHGISLDF